MTPKILVLNGPNLNMLGLREPGIYGSLSLSDIEERVRARAEDLGAEIAFFQSNWEGALVDELHKARGTCQGLIVNPAGLTHTSVVLHDAIKAAELMTVEVHLSNPHAREEFRHRSYVSPLAAAVIAGAGAKGYEFALELLVERLRG